MSQIDFLPESYRKTARRRGRTVRQIILCLTVAIGLIGTGFLMKTHSANLKRTAERLEDTVETEQGSLGMLAMLQRERDQLQKTLDLQADLIPAVSYREVVAALTHALPPEVAVRELTLRTVRPTPEKPETDADRESRLANSARQKNNPAPAKIEPHLIGIEFEGVSPSDMAVAKMLATLDADPLFSRVTMRTSRAIERDLMRMRQFSLTVTVDLNRRFLWTDRPTEVADAH